MFEAIKQHTSEQSMSQNEKSTVENFNWIMMKMQHTKICTVQLRTYLEGNA